jgi:hypothetical protein
VGAVLGAILSHRYDERPLDGQACRNEAARAARIERDTPDHKMSSHSLA